MAETVVPPVVPAEVPPKDTTATPPAAETAKQEDGTVLVDGKVYIRKDSYDVIAAKNREYKSSLEKDQAAKDAAEAKALEEQGKWKELAEKKDAELAAIQAKVTSEKKLSKFREIAQKAGAQSADVLAKLIDLEAVKVGEDGQVDEVDLTSTIEALKTANPFLFTTPEPVTVGAKGGAPAGDRDGVTTFKRSQLSDTKFYQANRDAIIAATNAGKIIDDVSGK